MNNNGQDRQDRKLGSKLGTILMWITILFLALRVGYVELSRPASVEANKITEVWIDTNGDTILDVWYQVGQVSVGRFDDGSIALRFTQVATPPFP